MPIMTTTTEQISRDPIVEISLLSLPKFQVK